MSTQPIPCSETPGCCDGYNRRDFLKLLGWTAAASAVGPMAGPFTAAEAAQISHFVPADKKLAKGWVEALFRKGEREIFRGHELDTIGMPINGIAAGQLYLCGDGTLGNWEIFNYHEFLGYGDKSYIFRKPTKPVDHGFAVAFTQNGRTDSRPLDRTGFADVAFIGEYPIGIVRYEDDDSPVAVELEAFAPFIPLNGDDSTLPMTFLRYTVTNTSDAALDVSVLGKLENAVLFHNRHEGLQGIRRTRVVRDGGRTYIVHSAEPGPESEPSSPVRETKSSRPSTAAPTVTGPPKAQRSAKNPPPEPGPIKVPSPDSKETALSTASCPTIPPRAHSHHRHL